MQATRVRALVWEDPTCRGAAGPFDADRDEDEVFCDISMAVDSKLFPNKEAAAGSSDLDPSMMLDTGEITDTGSDYEDQVLRI
ncbi:hypothetical protein J1605_019295 [Eschrichtius robustus]|uniref:Uncharacterized protein n=1 Tax=Eschrichtius robustus TaxID=9764 RepID=A0AB34HQW8_ESCRO|nr:hypothetical protein J1605_019295 [Eschrichtius robustus]